MSRQVLIVDSSQISTFMECPQRWEYEYVENITPRIDGKDSMLMGSHGHKLLEIYYAMLGKGATQLEAVQECNHFKEVVKTKLSPERFKAVNLKFDLYVAMHSANQDFRVETRINEEGKQIPMVEIGFAHTVLDTPEYFFVLEGLIDALAIMDKMQIFVDHKWQDRMRRLYKKSVQFRNYSMVTGRLIGIVNYVRMADKYGPDTFKRDIISFSPMEVRHWKEELLEIFFMINRAVQEKKREQRWASCSGKFEYQCNYTKLCEEFNPQTKQMLKIAHYMPKTPWEPWKLAEVKLDEQGEDEL